MRIFLSLFFLGWLPILGFSQQLDFTEHMLYLDVGLNVQPVDFADLNGQINGLYPEIDEWMLNYQVGLTYVNNKSQFGIYGDFSRMPFQKQDSGQLSFKGSGLGIKYALPIVNKNHFFLFPELGLGRRSYKLTLIDTEEELTIQEILGDNIHNYRFRKVSYYLNLGAGMNTFFKVSNFYIGIGITGGYQYEFGKWKYAGINAISDEIGIFSGFWASFHTKIAMDQR